MATKHYKNYIDGQWVDSLSGKTQEIINPATGEVLAEITSCSTEDAQRAIAAAKRSFYEDGQWRYMDVRKKADLLLQVAAQLEKNQQEFAELECLNNGKPLREALADVMDAVSCFQYYAGLINKPSGEVYEVHDGFGRMQSFTVREPVGVCALITPWNYPLLMGVQKMAPALAAGNSVIYKPSSNTPLTSVKLIEIIDQLGFPQGVVNFITGPGGEAGRELAESTDVDMITFTGSTAVGQGIALAAAKNLKRTGLELGGKSPNIIFADADLEGAVEWAMIGIFYNQGEVCSAGSRILVEASFKERFVQRFKERAEQMRIGNPLHNPDMGPLISQDHLQTVLNYIEIGKEEGAQCITGGYRYVEGECAKGYFVAPTIFDHCNSEMRIVREEIFGPVVTIQTFESEEEAIEMANDSIYGLAGAVFTTDGARALRVIHKVRAGVTWVNCYNPAFIEAPWGGFKMSGLGRELGVQGLEEFQEIKQININLTPGPIHWYENTK